MKTRNSSFELLKVIAIILICLSSAIPYGAMYQGTYGNVYVNINSAIVVKSIKGGVLLTLFRWLGQIGDTLFLMCSAWFLCDSKKAKSRKYLKLVIDSFIISILGLFITCLFIRPTLKEIVRSVLPITFQNNWFVGCYIIYYIIHPLLNKAVSDYEKRQYKMLVAILVVAYSIIATISKRYYFTNLVAFVMIHYVVSYCKKYEIWNHEKKYDFIAIFICGALILFCIFGMQFAGNRIEILKNRNLLLCHFYNPLILCLVLPSLFLAVKSNINSKTINTISSLSLFIYLIHGNYFWQAYGKYFVAGKLMDMGASRLGAVLILFCMITFASIMIAKIYMLTIGRITDMFVEQIKAHYFALHKLPE